MTTTDVLPLDWPRPSPTGSLTVEGSRNGTKFSGFYTNEVGEETAGVVNANVTPTA